MSNSQARRAGVSHLKGAPALALESLPGGGITITPSVGGTVTTSTDDGAGNTVQQFIDPTQLLTTAIAPGSVGVSGVNAGEAHLLSYDYPATGGSVVKANPGIATIEATDPLSTVVAQITVGVGAGSGEIALNAPSVGAYGALPVAQPTVTGSRGGNAALASLLTALASIGWIIDGTTP